MTFPIDPGADALERALRLLPLLGLATIWLAAATIGLLYTIGTIR